MIRFLTRSRLNYPAAWLVVALLIPLSTLAQTRYVATNGSNTTGNGTVQSPWATISFAIDQVSDGTTIEVAPGTYNGRVRLDQTFSNGVVIRSTQAYRARLRHDDGAALICFSCQGITVEGFDIAHSATNQGALLIQIQTPEARRVTLRNNIIHDSTNNDLLKINNGTQDILVQGNLFYNQSGPDEHIDINSVRNVTVIDNVFFNAQSSTNTSSFVLVKDSNGNSDGILGSSNIKIRRNVFLNWQGSSGQSFVRVGEDGTQNFEAQNVLIENNLMLGNSNSLMRSAFTVQGSNNIRFQFNTVVGDLPSRSFAARLLKSGSNQANSNVVLRNNIWSDPTGSMGAEGFNGADVFDAPSGSNSSVILDNNLYFNGGNAIPSDTAQEVRVSQDNNARFGNPRLPLQTSLSVPVFNGVDFADGSSSIREVFVALVNQFGRPAAGSPAKDTAAPVEVPQDDILGASRSSSPDIGALEINAPAPPGPPPSAGGNKTRTLTWLFLLLDDESNAP